MKLWRDKDLIWIQSDDGPAISFHKDYASWFTRMMPDIAHGNLQSMEFVLAPIDDKAPAPVPTWQPSEEDHP